MAHGIAPSEVAATKMKTGLFKYAAFDALEKASGSALGQLRAVLWNNDPSSNHFVVPLTGFAGQRTSRR